MSDPRETAIFDPRFQCSAIEDALEKVRGVRRAWVADAAQYDIDSRCAEDFARLMGVEAMLVLILRRCERMVGP